MIYNFTATCEVMRWVNMAVEAKTALYEEQLSYSVACAINTLHAGNVLLKKLIDFSRWTTHAAGETIDTVEDLLTEGDDELAVRLLEGCWK